MERLYLGITVTSAYSRDGADSSVHAIRPPQLAGRLSWRPLSLLDMPVSSMTCLPGLPSRALIAANFFCGPRLPIIFHDLRPPK